MMESGTQILTRGSGECVARCPRVLLVEDDAAFRRLVANYLGRAGYDVREVSDGAEAVDRIADWLADGVAPDVVVTDVRLPYLTGLHVAAALRGVARAIPCVVMTAFGDAATHALAARLGVVATLDKPFDVDTLRAVLDGVVATTIRRPRVLVVDESAVQASALAEILRDEGMQANFVTGAGEALETVARETPNLVVLEAVVHGDRGVTLLARMRELAPSLHAIVLSAYSIETPDVRALLDARAAYVAKPVDLVRLCALIPELVARGHPAETTSAPGS